MADRCHMVGKRLGRAVSDLTLWALENLERPELRHRQPLLPAISASHFRLNSPLFIHKNMLFPVSFFFFFFKECEYHLTKNNVDSESPWEAFW